MKGWKDIEHQCPSVESSQARRMPPPRLEGWPWWRLGLALVSLSCDGLSSPGTLAFCEDKRLLNLGGPASTQRPGRWQRERAATCKRAQLSCSLFSLGRTSFLQKDCCLWRRRLSGVKASMRLPSQSGLPRTRALMFGQLRRFCPNAAGPTRGIHPGRCLSGEAAAFPSESASRATAAATVLRKGKWNREVALQTSCKGGFHGVCAAVPCDGMSYTAGSVMLFSRV